MKKISASALQFIPASHEDPQNPGSLKKILFKRGDLLEGGTVQMMNWALLPKGMQFALHYHEDMAEVFIMVCGQARITIDHEEETLGKGDAVFIPIGSKHTMVNICAEDVEYVAIGISLGRGGRTIVI